MKKLVFVVFLFALSGCGVSDEEVTLKIMGRENMYHELGTQFSDPGAEIVGSELVIIGEVNPDVLGTYEIVYTDMNNTIAGTRYVHVVDSKSPSIEIAGEVKSQLFLGEEYTVQDVKIKDKDPLVTVTYSGESSFDEYGLYTYEYIATDSSGNTSSTHCEVEVVKTKHFKNRLHPEGFVLDGENLIMYQGVSVFRFPLSVLNNWELIDQYDYEIDLDYDFPDQHFVKRDVVVDGNYYVLSGTLYNKSESGLGRARPVLMKFSRDSEVVWLTIVDEMYDYARNIHQFISGYAIQTTKEIDRLDYFGEIEFSTYFADKNGNITYIFPDNSERKIVQMTTHKNDAYLVIKDTSEITPVYYLERIGIDGESRGSIEIGYNGFLEIMSDGETVYAITDEEGYKLVRIESDLSLTVLRELEMFENINNILMSQFGDYYFLSNAGRGSMLTILDRDFNTVKIHELEEVNGFPTNDAVYFEGIYYYNTYFGRDNISYLNMYDARNLGE